MKIMLETQSVFFTSVISAFNVKAFDKNMRGDPEKMELIYKKKIVYSYMSPSMSPSEYSPFDTMHLLRRFSTAQNSF